MMQPLTRAERFAAGLWVVLSLVVGNGVYDLLIAHGIKEYLFRHVLAEAGRGPAVPITQIIDVAVADARWISILAGSVILLAGMVTVRLMRPTRSEA
jgi:hypothetical protein